MSTAVLLATAVMLMALWWQYGDIGRWADATALARGSRLTLLIGFGALVYGIMLIAGGLRRHHLEKGAS